MDEYHDFLLKELRRIFILLTPLFLVLLLLLGSGVISAKVFSGVLFVVCGTYALWRGATCDNPPHNEEE